MELFKLFGTILIDDKEAINKLKEVDKKAEKTGGTMGNAFNKLKDFSGKIGAAVGVVSSIIGGAGINSANEYAKAINNIKAKTGYTNEAMKGMNDTLLSIYKDNFGDSFEDIGNAISTIGQQTGLTGDKLKGITENALMMRDTFEFDVGESIRSANMLMDQFGIDGNEAYNLIAQGAQSGLDKNGDLLDTINEYSVHFKQMGFDSTEMFNMLVNGAADGTFSVDKLGDAVKEFGIRTKDGSKQTQDAYKSLGLDVDKISQQFAKGGDSANQAFNTVNQALMSVKDPLKQNQIGVALYGTQWEDLGKKGIEALTKTNGKISQSKDALKGINNVKYNDIGSALEGIKRNLETSVLIPLGQKLLPKLSELAGWIQTNGPVIQNVVQNTFNIFANVIGFCVNNANLLIPALAGIVGALVAMQIIGTITKVMNAWKTATQTQTFAQWALNAAMDANPIGIIIMLIGLVIAAGVALYMNWDKVAGFFKWVWADIQKKISIGINFIKTIWSKFTGAISSAWNAVWGGVKSFFSSIWNWLVDKVVNNVRSFLAVFSAIKNGVGNIINKVKDIIVNGFTGAIDFIKSLPGKALQWGKDFILGLVDGIKNAVKWVVDAVKGIGEKIKNFLHFSRPDEGPLRDYQKWMPDFMRGMAEGINKNKNLITDAIAGLSADAKININGQISTALNQAKQQQQTFNFYGNMNLLSQGDKNRNLQQLQFLAGL